MDAGDKRVKCERYYFEGIQYSGQKLCFVSAFEDSIRSAEVMQQTVLIPSVLMDFTANSLMFYLVDCLS